MIKKSEICAIITTFSPDDDFLKRVRIISKQVGYVVIVDDSGTGYNSGLVGNINNVSIIFNEFNSGIAHALNRGVEFSSKKDFKYFVTFDDDTVVDENYVDEITSFIEYHPELNIGVIALDREQNDEDTDYKIKRTLITSGSFFSLNIFKIVGGFNERLFIDLVDYDFTTKIRKKGFCLVQLNKEGMQHSVGQLRDKKVFGLLFKVYNHSPFRLYYQIRNSFYFLKTFLVFDPVLSLLLFSHVFRIIFKAVFFEDSKKQRLYFISRGLFDGFFGRLGKLRN